MECDEGLPKLGVEIARWSVAEVRALHEADSKVVEPLVQSMRAKRGATRRQDCRTARTFDGLRICDGDESPCRLSAYLTLARTSLYSCVIYCNLFPRRYRRTVRAGQLPLNVGPLGSELRRRHWMRNRVYHYEWYVHLGAVLS